MFYAMMRPSEVMSLTKHGCVLPEQGWGRLVFADASPAAGRDFTDDGRVHESRGLKGRPRQFSARRGTRNVPIPPELVVMLRVHIELFGTDENSRLFRSENGNPIQPSTYWRVWGKSRALALRPAQLATLLMRRRLYDLRHSGITWRLNSGVPPTEIAAWAGHSVEMLLRAYARCVVGMEDVWIARMDAALRRTSRMASPRLTVIKVASEHIFDRARKPASADFRALLGHGHRRQTAFGGGQWRNQHGVPIGVSAAHEVISAGH